MELPNQTIPTYKDLNTNVYFHGKAKHKIFKENRLKEMAADKRELLERIEYLKNKFIETAQDGKNNLYIYKCPINDYTTPSEIKNKINKLYQVLETICSNRFDLLCIFKEGFIKDQEITQSKGKIFIRNIQDFAPEIDVTIKDKKIHQYWSKIFNEFKPNFKLKKHRKFKFE